MKRKSCLMSSSISDSLSPSVSKRAKEGKASEYPPTNSL